MATDNYAAHRAVHNAGINGQTAVAAQIGTKELGIDLASRQEAELFKWLLACLLLGKPIQGQVARRAYEQMVGAGIESLDDLLGTTWEELVAILDEAHYVRYDFSTATKLLDTARTMKEHYGLVINLVEQSVDADDAQHRLEAFRGVGPVTAAIFMGEVAGVWFAGETSHDLQAAQTAAKRLRRGGYEAYFIGGAVRDQLLGRVPKDFDLVTNATPDQIMAVPEFAKSQFTDAAQAYGVTRVRLSAGAGRQSELEIATYRRDIDAHLGRKATSVEFATLADDVKRRDFTVNALAMDPVTGEVVDYVGGRGDLERKLIRFIGEPARRIAEDPLRVLRAIRLKNQLEFEYERATAEAIRRAVAAGRIEDVAPDRLRQELTLMLVHTSRRQAVVDLDEFGIMQRLLPEVAGGKGTEQPPQFHSEGDVWAHQLLILDKLPERPSKRLAWAALLHDIGKKPTQTRPRAADNHIRFHGHYAVGAEMARAVLRRLKFSNQDIADITWMIHAHLSVDDIPQMRPSRRKQYFQHAAFGDLLELHYADASASVAGPNVHPPSNLAAIERLWHEYLSTPPPLRHPSLKTDAGIDGHWLMRRFGDRLGERPGPLIGRILQELEEYYVDTGETDRRVYAQRARHLIDEAQAERRG